MAGKTPTADFIAEKRKQHAERSGLRKDRSRPPITLTALSKPAFQVSTPAYLDLGTIPPAVVDDPQYAALEFLFSTYARPCTYKFEHRGFLEHVFEVHESSAKGSAVRLATLAVSTFLLASWMNQKNATQASRSFYSKAISAMKEQLSSTNACSNDEMLVSILLLQLYETVVGMLKSGKESRAHLNGALAVIKHRGIESFDSELSHDLLLSVRTQIVDASLQSSKPIPAGIFGWSKIRPESHQLPRNQLELINMKIATLQAMLLSALQANARAPAQSMHQILAQATLLEQLLGSWYLSLPQAWYPIRVSTKENFPESIIAAAVYQELCEVYPSISVAGTINKYRISLLRVKSIMLQCLPQLPRTLPNLKKQADLMNQIQVLVDNVCASVPFHLGDRINPGWMGDKSVRYPRAPGQGLPEGHHQVAQALGGWKLLEPLSGLLLMKIKLKPAQRGWIGSQMMRISRIYNYNRN